MSRRRLRRTSTAFTSCGKVMVLGGGDGGCHIVENERNFFVSNPEDKGILSLAF